MQSIKEKTHHSIMVIMGIRKRICCPDCGETKEYYIKNEWIHSTECYNDGYSVEINIQNSHSYYSCEECGFSSY